MYWRLRDSDGDVWVAKYRTRNEARVAKDQLTTLNSKSGLTFALVRYTTKRERVIREMENEIKDLDELIKGQCCSADRWSAGAKYAIEYYIGLLKG